ncbi:PilZ domain-containing protein [Maridesulfovibrio ferrireducens]|uniref:PilZ domain-containing protein n=1 Tax=Maridesulfovibrio ferrireducens TaxID=246191 RepID=A0A1G9FXW2_9BACT|nr:PilZ domain-containing protein [Maridesulfovibrio ferrireducens]SDK93192.1 PilZ domain-containing protein [Maridesulfovibrio ferrireducens]
MSEKQVEQDVVSSGASDNLGLQHGGNANVELFSTGERLWGEVVGIRPGYFLSIWLPALREGNYKRILIEDSAVTVRAKCDGCYLCGFRATVTRVMTYPYPLLYLAYPSKFEKVNLRNNKRVECFQSVILTYKDKEYKGVFRDISEGGGRISFVFRKGETMEEIKENEFVNFKFQYEEGAAMLFGVGVVRNFISCGNKISMGFKFVSFEDDSHTLLKKVIESFDI